MIIQGTNKPLNFKFSVPMTSINDVEISLFNREKELKHWSIEDITITNNVITAPLEQEETIHFPKGRCWIEIKWINQNNKTIFAKPIPNFIIERKDKTVMEERS